jgi:hypothetical protein
MTHNHSRTRITNDLYALAEWLRQCQIDTVVMESTGV